MSKILEVINSLNDENIAEVKEQLITEANAQNENNRHLYSRAKKAEGFILNKETGKWAKKEIEKKEIPSENKSVLDYGKKAYLKACDISGAEEITLVEEYLATGKELEEIVENKHFKNDLKDLRDAKSVKDATPSNSKRSSNTAKDSVGYWLAKGELPPNDQPELRRKVVNAKIQKEKGTDDNFGPSVVSNASGIEIK